MEVCDHMFHCSCIMRWVSIFFSCAQACPLSSTLGTYIFHLSWHVTNIPFFYFWLKWSLLSIYTTMKFRGFFYNYMSNASIQLILFVQTKITSINQTISWTLFLSQDQSLSRQTHLQTSWKAVLQLYLPAVVSLAHCQLSGPYLRHNE